MMMKFVENQDCVRFVESPKVDLILVEAFL